MDDALLGERGELLQNRYHLIVWPEMQAALRETGWRNYSLFLRDHSLLAGYLGTEDFESARAGVAQHHEINGRGQREMADFFVQPDGVLQDRAMRPLEEVFSFMGRFWG